MSEITHTPEHQSKAARDDSAARELAACYARVFLGDDDGKRVLADLRIKWGTHRPVFRRGEGNRFDTIAAALTDGHRHVMIDIEDAIMLGAPNLKPT